MIYYNINKITFKIFLKFFKFNLKLKWGLIKNNIITLFVQNKVSN